MMKFSGEVLLLISITLIGMRISLLLKNREKIAQQLLVFLNCLSVSIEFSRMNLPEIIENLSGEESMNKLDFLSYCVELSDMGADFPDAWKKSIGQFKGIDASHKDKLISLGSLLGSTDVQGQLSTIRVYIDFFEQYYKLTAEQRAKYGTAVPVITISLGTVLLICLA